MDGWFGPKPQYAQNITQKTEEKPFFLHGQKKERNDTWIRPMNINQFGASIIEGLDTGTFAPYSDAPDNTFPPYTPTPTASVPYTPTLTTTTPYTPEPKTYAPATARNITAAQTTARNTTASQTTTAQTTAVQTTAAQTTARNTTAAQTTAAQTTAAQTTAAQTTAAQTTAAQTTARNTTAAAQTTAAQTTASQTTASQTTAAQTTAAQTTAAQTTAAQTTTINTTASQTTARNTTAAQTTARNTSAAPATAINTTAAQTTSINTTATQTTAINTTDAKKISITDLSSSAGHDAPTTARNTTAAQTTARNTTAAPKNGEILTLLTRNNISSEILETFPFTKEDVQLWASTLPNKANTSPSITSDTILINIFDPKIVEFIKKNKDAFQTFLGNDQRGDKKIADVDAQKALYDYYIEIDKYFILQDNNIDATTLNEKRKIATQDAFVTYKSHYLNLFNIVFGILFVIGFIFIFMRTTFQPAMDSVKNSASGAGSMIWNSITSIGSLPGKILSSGPVKYLATIPGKIMSLFRKKPNTNIQNVASPAANP